MADGIASTSTSSLPSTASPLPSSVVLTAELMSTFKPARVFNKHVKEGKSFTSLSFDDKGELLLTSGEDETMMLYNAKTGKHQKQLYSKKYGVHLARFTHKSTAIIHASTKEDDAIRYLSLHDNNYMRYFKGHKKKVVSLEMSPQDDTFLSGATDDTVRLWDLRTQNAQGVLHVANHPSVAYDPSGSVFAVALNLRSTILFYDLKNFDKQPFLTVTIDDPILPHRTFPPRIPIFTSLEFSNDGKWLLVGTSGEVHYVIDAFSGGVVARLENSSLVSGLERLPIHPFTSPKDPEVGISSEEVCWTPDGRFVISGSIDGKIYIWDVSPPVVDSARPPPGPGCTLFPIKIADGHLGKGPSRAVAFNPRSAMFATAGNELALWLPDTNELGFPGVGMQGVESTR